MKNEISSFRKILRIFSIFIVFETLFTFYRTADDDTRKNVKHLIKRETRLFREFFESVTDYFVITSDLISEQDIIDIQNEQKEVRKNQFSVFTKIIKILMLRLFKTAKLIVKTLLYPLRVFMNLIITVNKTTTVFAKSLYENLCLKLTQIIVGVIKFICRAVRYPLSLVRVSFDLVEDFSLLLDVKIHSIV